MNTEPQWVQDTPATRAYHLKTLQITGTKGENKGKFKMHVSETDPQGRRRPGFLIVGLSPEDEAAGWTVLNSIGKKSL